MKVPERGYATENHLRQDMYVVKAYLLFMHGYNLQGVEEIFSGFTMPTFIL